MYQGLGQTYLNVFLFLTTSSFVIATLTIVVIHYFTRIRGAWCVLSTTLLFLILAYGANKLFHRDLFVWQHQRHNTLVPKSGCISYQPSFGHLFASYEMSRSEFEKWVTTHPMKLEPYDGAIAEHDGRRLGFHEPELSYASEMAPNGGQMRVYFKNGTMYFSYNVM